MRKTNEKGVITLEACVAVLSFLILMLLLSSLFVMFMAQNVTSHTVLQTSQSLSMDVYSTERLSVDSGSIGTVGDYVGQFITGLFGSSEDNPAFVTDDKWYDEEEEQVAAAVKNRFVGYLTGGNTSEADEFLERMNIVDGLEGLDFSSSYVENDTLYIVLKYNLEYDFNIWNVGTVEVKQTTCSKLWK